MHMHKALKLCRETNQKKLSRISKCLRASGNILDTYLFREWCGERAAAVRLLQEVLSQEEQH